MKTMLLAATLTLAAATPAAAAANLLVNGDFETGNYVGWSTVTEASSNGAIAIEAYDGVAPISGLAYQNNAAGGRFFSMTDQSGPGAYSLIQSFTLTSATTVLISFDMFANSSAAVINNGRSALAGPNQNAVVDILTGTAGAFTVAPGDIISVLYGPGADPLIGSPNPWISYSSSLFLNAGTYQIRFAQADNQLFFQQGVDNVSVAGVPEASTWAMMITGFGLMGFAARRRRAIAIA